MLDSSICVSSINLSRLYLSLNRFFHQLPVQYGFLEASFYFQIGVVKLTFPLVEDERSIALLIHRLSGAFCKILPRGRPHFSLVRRNRLTWKLF